MAKNENNIRVNPTQPTLFQRVANYFGEISVLRDKFTSGWSFKYSSQYQLDSSRVDYNLTRELYRNTNNKYKLGAGFAKPIVNTTAGFMGAPSFSHQGEEANNLIQEGMEGWGGKLYRINRNTLRDADQFARLSLGPSQFDSKKDVFNLNLIPPERVTLIADPLTGGWMEVVIRHPVREVDKDGRESNIFYITETITPAKIEVEVDSNAPAKYRDKNGSSINKWGFIPIVQFRNEAEEHQVYGSSELEPIEPFMKAYHDTMLFAIQGSKMFSRPKAKFSLSDVDKFIKDNFSPEEIKNGKLKFADREIFFMQQGDEAGFITAESGMDGATTLLKFIFRCIVDVSETPEFAFGTAVASSKASVSEQMIPLTRKIQRKRGMFEEPYGELGSMYLAMASQVKNIKPDTYRVKVDWEEISARNDKEVADTVRILADGLTMAVESNFLSVDAASEFMREFVPSMLPFIDVDGDDDEKRRIVRSAAWRLRLEDREGLEEPGKDN